jgi:hypothetical protein
VYRRAQSQQGAQLDHLLQLGAHGRQRHVGEIGPVQLGLDRLPVVAQGQAQGAQGGLLQGSESFARGPCAVAGAGQPSWGWHPLQGL